MSFFQASAQTLGRSVFNRTVNDLKSIENPQVPP